MDYSFSLIFNNKPGFVIRVALILERRSFSIKSLFINSEFNNQFSEMFLTISGPELKYEQVQKQLLKLIDVVSLKEEAKLLQNAAEQLMELDHAS